MKRPEQQANPWGWGDGSGASCGGDENALRRTVRHSSGQTAKPLPTLVGTGVPTAKEEFPSRLSGIEPDQYP